MCYWGLYEAEMFRHSLEPQYADEALAKAVSLEKHASKAERLYIDAAVAQQQAAKAAKGEPDSSKEIAVWRELVKRNPRDTQARIFLAEAVGDGYDDSGEPREGQKEALEILRRVLKDEPDNSAANHYWIHAVEPGNHPEQALRSAQILGSLAPLSGHMVHMPGHIFYRVGDYAQAQKAFDASMQADESYMRSQRVDVDNDWNYVHNLMYSVANLMELGQLKEATELSAKLAGARGELESTLYVWSARDSIARISPSLPVALRTGDWERALTLLKSANPPEKLSYLAFLIRGLSNFAGGMQAVESHDLEKAETASASLDAGLWRLLELLKDEEDSKKAQTANPAQNNSATTSPPKLQVMPDAQPEPLVRNLSIMSLELRAGILVAKNQIAEAKKLFAQAAQEEKALGYREPPGYIRPVAESEAAALMAAGDWADAKAAYGRALVERPKSGFPLFGIAMSNESAGDSKAAAAAYAEFIAAWSKADSDLAQLAHAREFVEKHQAATSGK
jgi:tetratricopeptide (TPR) repeat protein